MADRGRTYNSAATVVSPRGGGQLGDLLSVIDLRGRGLRRACRRWDGFAWFGAIIFAVALAGALATSIGALRQAAVTGQWHEFFDMQILMIAVAAVQCCGPLVFVVAWPLARAMSRQLTAATLALAHAASVHDTALAPPSFDTHALSEHAPPAGQSELRVSLRRVNSALALQSLILGILALLCALGLAIVTVVAAILDPAVGSRQVLAIASGAGTIIALVAALVWLSDSVRLRKRAAVQADGLGLRWNQLFPRRRGVSVQWDEIRAIFFVDHLGGFRHWQACVVDAGDLALAFEVASGTRARSHPEAERLVNLVLARTRLLPLDLTTLAAELSSRRNGPEYRRGYTQLADHTALASHPPFRLPLPVSPRRMALSALLIFLPLALIPTAAVAGFSVQHVQEQQYTALLAEARAHTPFYHDALSAPDSDWPVHGPTSSDPNSYSFANDGYLITPAAGTSAQDSPFVEVYAPGTYHDAVVEVTLRMASGGVPYGSAALALHALSGDARGNLHFGINGDGSWGVLDLGHCPPGASGSNDSTCGYDSTDQASVIHHAAWAPNTLTAILRGNQVICFINGVYVGSTMALGPQSGRLGLGVEGLGAPVAFSDFTIYPL